MDLKCSIEFFLFPKKTDVMYFESMNIENSLDLINGLMTNNSNSYFDELMILYIWIQASNPSFFTLQIHCNVYFVKDKLCTVVVATNVKIIIHGWLPPKIASWSNSFVTIPCSNFIVNLFLNTTKIRVLGVMFLFFTNNSETALGFLSTIINSTPLVC